MLWRLNLKFVQLTRLAEELAVVVVRNKAPTNSWPNTQKPFLGETLESLALGASDFSVKSGLRVDGLVT